MSNFVQATDHDVHMHAKISVYKYVQIFIEKYLKS
jgi:hypothetical protein